MAKKTPGLPRVGVTTRFRSALVSHSIHRGYIEQVARSGGLPLAIPTVEPEFCDDYLDTVDGLLLTGGEDIDPRFSPGTPRQRDYTYHPRRDAFEFRLARGALHRGLPVLGICRGSQVLWSVTGNPLVPHLPDVNGGQVLHRHSPTEPAQHSVRLVPGSKVARAYDEPVVKVASLHHQGLGPQTPGDLRWRVVGHAEDGMVEAFEREDTAAPWAVGVLWHPELPVGDDRTDPLIAAFVSAIGTS
ncbi:gamma-glutamyl-gamma-aminobutyrate hydrolase family protein [Streptomyces buecherae]|uniref:gamma-glutamyl-gamma-aminobutyrate hydrolase family protein n=1 Tax=Streptomyces buecherae TaxID=2763006 RepID=UPI001C9A4285|nr:gamma-glutamyl-gamma-aminobutyrate hydrolase family protein [Streptomyces buecherae]